jgi:hypothetical protein
MTGEMIEEVSYIEVGELDSNLCVASSLSCLAIACPVRVEVTVNA